MNPPARKSTLQVATAFALVYVLWGSTYLGIGIAVKHIPPFLMGACRFVTAGLLMLAFRASTGNVIRIGRRDLFRLTVIGCMLLTGGTSVLGWSETLIPTGLAALLVAITPLWFLLLERFSHKGDHLSPAGIIGISMGLVGVVVLLWPDLRAGINVGHRELAGAGLVLCGSVSWAIGSVLSKRWKINADPYGSSGWQMLLAGTVNIFISFGAGEYHRVVWARSSVLAIAYLVVFGSLVGFTAYIWLLQNVPTPKVATYAYVNPIVAVFLGWLVLHEKITPYIFAGATIVVASVALVTWAKSHQNQPNQTAIQRETELAGTAD